MHLFNIYHFRLLSLQELEAYILRHNSLRYEISIPKKEWEDDTDFLRWQYYMAAYAGHKLSLIATSFAYTVPCPHRSDPFRFEIEYFDPKQLGITLHNISEGFYNKRKEVVAFQDEALKHFHNCFTRKTESACWGLLHIANKKTF